MDTAESIVAETVANDTPNASNVLDLSTFSFEQLEELKRQKVEFEVNRIKAKIAELEQEKQRIRGDLEQEYLARTNPINDEATALHAELRKYAAPNPAPRKFDLPARPPRVVRDAKSNGGTTLEYIANFLREEGRACSITEVYEGVKKRGWTSNATDPRTVIVQTLGTRKDVFVNPSRGYYSLKDA